VHGLTHSAPNGFVVREAADGDILHRVSNALKERNFIDRRASCNASIYKLSQLSRHVSADDHPVTLRHDQVARFLKRRFKLINYNQRSGDG
jgi:hypothetical protein